MPALFRRPRLNPRQVPQVPVEIDWSHPLSVGLIGLYIPSRGGADLAGNGPPIFPQSGATFAPSGVGSGASSLAASSGMASTANPTRFERTGTNLGLVHVGWHTSTTASSASETIMFGIAFTAATYLPFTITMNNGAFHFCTNTGGTFATYGTSLSPNLGLNVLAVSNYTGGGNLWSYKNGVVGNAGTNTGTGNVNWAGGANPHVDMGANQFNTALFTNCIHLAGMVYDWGASQIPANIAAWLGNEPFAMLRPIVRRTYLMPVSTSSGTRAQVTQASVEQFASPIPQGLVTQAALEQWALVNTQAQATQLAIEKCAPGGTTTPLVVMTQVALEQWASVAAAQATSQARVMVMA